MTETSTNEPGLEEPLILERLSDLDDQDEYLEHFPDIRGFAVLNPTGDEVGTVDDLYVNPRDRLVEMAAITFNGAVGYGGKRVLVPVEEIELRDGRVHIMTTDERINLAPEFRPELSNYEAYYEYWTDRPVGVQEESTEAYVHPIGRLQLEDEDEYERDLMTGE